ncbi:hypothetical protein C7382_10142 [Porphyromonas loveana]|uniref:Uncharacterized protein n=1 Tax=Porphyromonas loveana TaxID=1884669 RepID=A0A2U1FSG5_9PORP|nr:hypothetical protein C7382_10142 [Porphyromonas loveana]
MKAMMNNEPIGKIGGDSSALLLFPLSERCSIGTIAIRTAKHYHLLTMNRMA